jgi:hypothetical protein
VGSRPAAPRPAPVAGAPRSLQDRPAGGDELDLNAVVLPVLARQYGPTLAAVLATAALTWLTARRRYRRKYRRS